MNVNDNMRVLRTRKWVMDHNLSKEVIDQMEKITMTAPGHLFGRPLESALRFIFTQACRELKNG